MAVPAWPTQEQGTWKCPAVPPDHMCAYHRQAALGGGGCHSCAIANTLLPEWDTSLPQHDARNAAVIVPASNARPSADGSPNHRDTFEAC